MVASDAGIVKVKVTSRPAAPRSVLLATVSWPAADLDTPVKVPA